MNPRMRAPRGIAAVGVAALVSLVSSVSLAVLGLGAPVAGAAVGAAKQPQVTCKQLTRSQIQPLMSTPITSVKVTKAGMAGQQCVFSGAESVAIDVLVDKGSFSTQGFRAEVKAMTPKVAVKGVAGAKAYRDTGDDQIVALKGDTYCSVSLGSGDTIPGVGAIELANNGSSDLSEHDNDIIATALGTICNRIYRSGNTTPSLDGLS